MDDRAGNASNARAIKRGPFGGPPMSTDASSQFAATVRELMAACGLNSGYSLFLHLDYSRSTVHRWLTGRARIPVAGARDVIRAFREHSARTQITTLLDDLDRLVDRATTVESDETRIRIELRNRGIRVGRIIEALRAAKLLPDDADKLQPLYGEK